MNAAEIAAALGRARRASGGWWSCLCPAHDDHSPSLSIRDGDRRPEIKCWAGCDARDVLAELRRRGLIAEAAPKTRPVRPPRTVQQDVDDAAIARRVTQARCIWSQAVPAAETLIETYLASRGISIPPPASIRLAPRCWHSDACGYLPAMVAAIVNVQGELMGIHRTFLRPDGTGKADVEPQRKMLGRVAGGAVRLASVAETLLVGEGLETCLSGMIACRTPAWAALSAGGIEALVLPPLPLAATVTILADHDRSGRGQAAARIAAARWLGEGRQVQIVMPINPGDINDVLLARDRSAHVAA